MSWIIESQSRHTALARQWEGKRGSLMPSVHLQHRTQQIDFNQAIKQIRSSLCWLTFMPRRGRPDRLSRWILLIIADSPVQYGQSLSFLAVFRGDWCCIGVCCEVSTVLFIKCFDPLIPVSRGNGSGREKKRCAGLIVWERDSTDASSWN